MRTDKRRNYKKVAKELLKNPDLTEREVSKKAKVSKTTVHNMKKELDQIGPKDPTILEITDKDLQIVILGQQIIHEDLQNEVEIIKHNKKESLKPEPQFKKRNIRPGEVSQVIKENTSRYTLFRGNATDEKGGLKIDDLLFDDLD